MHQGGGARASKKLLAAMAVLAVAFVVLAAVPVALTDSDAAETATVDSGYVNPTKISAASGTYYFTEDATVTIEAGGVGVATFYSASAYDSSKKTVTYDPLSGVSLTVAQGTMKYTASTGAYVFSVAPSTLTQGVLVTAGATPTYTAYPAEGTISATLSANENKVVIATAAVANSEDQFTVNVTSTSGETTVAKVQLVLNLDAAQTGNVVADSAGALTLYKAADTTALDASTFDGQVSITKGKVTATSTNALAWMRGIFGENTLYSVNEDVGLTSVDATKTLYAIASEPLTKSIAISATTDTDSSSLVKYWTIQSGFAAEDAVEIEITYSTAAISGSKLDSTGGAWTGVIQAESSADSFATGSCIGDLKLGADMNTGEAAIKVAAGSDVTISGSKTLTLGGTLTVEDEASPDAAAKLTIASGTTVKANSTNTIAVEIGATLVVKGTILPAETDTDAHKLVVTGQGTVNVLAGATITNVRFDSRLTVNIDSSVMKDVTINGESTGVTNYDQTQTVTVDGTWTLVDGAVVTVLGKLVVPEGSKIVIQDGAKLTLDNGATFDLEGDLEVAEDEKSGGGVLDIDKGTLDVYGSAVVSGTLNLNAGKIQIKQDGVLTIDENGSIETDVAVVVDSGAVLNINGEITVLSVENSGTVVIDSEVKTADVDVTIDQMADGAVVDIVNFTQAYTCTKALEISDAEMIFANAGKSNAVTDSEKNELEITIVQPTGADTKTVSGIKVVSSVTSKAKTTETESTTTGIYNNKVYTKIMDISGEIEDSAAKETTGAGIETAGAVVKLTGTYATGATRAYAIITGELSIAENSKFDLAAKAKLIVTGTLQNNKAVSGKGITSASGSFIDVKNDGKIIDYNDSLGDATVSAATYMVKTAGTSGDVKTYYYVTVDNALVAVSADSTIKTVEVLAGGQTMTADADLPTGVTLKVTGKLTVGAQAGDDVTLTVIDGATVNPSANISVNGTLYAEDKSNVKSATKVVSDVYSEETDENGKAVKNGWAQWTNLAAAIASGVDTITISKAQDDDNTYVEIANSLTIPEGVTLIVPDDVAPLRLADGVTLTIDGVLQTSQDITAKTQFAVNAMKVDGTTYNSSAIIVNGELLVADTLGLKAGDANSKSLIAGAPIYGAYYSVDEWDVITTIGNALAETDRTSGISVYGPIVGSDGTLEANDYSSSITVQEQTYKPIGANVTSADTVYTSLTMTSLTLGKGTSLVTTGAYTGSVVVGENSVTYGYLSGVTAKNSSDALVLTGTAATSKYSSLTVATGTVSLGYKTTSASETFAQSGSSYAMKIASGATAKVVNTGTLANLTVDGTFEVPAGATATVSKITVNGSVSVVASTASVTGGTLSIGGAYVGITSRAYTAATASVTGPFTLTSKMFVVNGATVEQDMSSYAKTEVYNGGSLWFTAYGSGSQTMVLSKAPVSNAVLAGWATSDGGEVKKKVTEEITIGASGYSKIYSVVKTEIYTIIIKADTGIGDLYLNGNIMQKGQISDGTYAYSAYWATVAYGIYEVTCKLANGYSGTAVLKDSTGASLSGNKFTTSEATDYTTENFQLTGIEKSGYVAPTEEKKDSGLTVTDYLLIVLVILVVVLAVIVALRLMRS